MMSSSVRPKKWLFHSERKRRRYGPPFHVSLTADHSLMARSNFQKLTSTSMISRRDLSGTISTSLWCTCASSGTARTSSRSMLGRIWIHSFRASGPPMYYMSPCNSTHCGRLLYLNSYGRQGIDALLRPSNDEAHNTSPQEFFSSERRCTL